MEKCCGWFNPCPPTCLGHEKMDKKSVDFNAELVKMLKLKLQIATDLLAEEARCHRAGVEVMMAEDPQYNVKFVRELIDQEYERRLSN